MVLQLPGWCPLQQLSRSPHDDLLSDSECHWRIVYNSIEQILSEGKSPVVLSNFECLLGTAWLSDSVMADMIDCLKRGIPQPVSDVASTLEPASRWRMPGKSARLIDLDEVCILDSAMSRKILVAFRTSDYGDVLRVFSKQCKFKTVRRILLPLNISWEGITLGGENLICVVDGHTDVASGPMLSTGVVQRQVHGRNKDAVSAGSKIFILVRRPAWQNVWCV